MGATGTPPSPIGVRTYDELAARLDELLTWAGLSIREAHRRVARDRVARDVPEIPAFDTVRRCVRPGDPGRARVDVDLLVEIAQAALGDEVRAVEWRQACQAISRGDGAAAVAQVDRELPPDPDGFVGRQSEVAELLRALAAARPGPAVALVHGMPGAGKTTLAVHVARRLREAGPYLAVDLRGYDPDHAPAAPAAVQDGMLRALGASGHEVSALDPHARQARLATLLRDRPAIILLDNAASAEQVLPLIPDVPGCQVLVTSRDALQLPRATSLHLDVLTPEGALELLRARLGAVVDANPDVAGRIADLGARLPLALAWIARRIGTAPGHSLSDHLEWLLEDRTRGKLEAGVELAFESSYQRLPHEQAGMLRLLALHPGRELDTYAAAALTATHEAHASGLLDELAAGSMLERRQRRRFQLHDLVRVFASDQALANESPSERRAALGRLRHYYRFAACLAMDAYAPHNSSRRPQPPDPGLPMPRLEDRAAARSWLDREYPNLVAVAMDAARNGSAAHAVDLSKTLFGYLDEAAHHDEAIRLHTEASLVAEGNDKARVLANLGSTWFRLGRYAEAVERLGEAVALHRAAGDHDGEARAHGNLGVAHAQLGEEEPAIEHLRAAIELHEASGNRTGEAIACGNLCHLFERIGRYEPAREYGKRHLRLAREVGHRLGEGIALGNLGSLLRRDGRHAEALDHHREALAIAREIGYREIEAEEVNDVATDLRLLGRTEEAVTTHREALAIATEHGNRYQQALAREGIGRVLIATGDPSGARVELKEAVRLHTELGTPEATDVLALLESLDG